MTTTAIPRIQIQQWLQSYIARFLGSEVSQIDIRTDFERFGLDSAVIVSMVSELEEWLAVELSPSLLFEYPTIEALAEYLCADCSDSSAPGEAR